MNNRREFIKRSAIAGMSFAGFALANSNVIASEQASAFNVKTTELPAGTIYQSISFDVSECPGQLSPKAIGIFHRLLSEHTGIDFAKTGNNSLKIKLRIISQSMPAEAFRIEIQAEKISIFASDENGILYGLGKLLHTSFLNESGFSPGKWQGLSVPEKPFRNIYFATHFHNFYHEAPVEKVINYIEELAFWGYNTITVWFDMHGFTSIVEPAAQAMLDRLALILRAGKEAGMKIMLTMLANEGYSTSPKELRAVTPKQIRLRGHYGVEICPSQPGGLELIVKQFGEEIDAFQKRGLTIDFLSLWPYDQGGCGCDRCIPWGSNGYLKAAKKITELAHQRNPGVQVVLSTWLFDCVEVEGEWAGLAEEFTKEKPWVDYIMADSHETFPAYLLKNPVPGNLPLLNFPEISMWNSSPWGGFGANPLPERFQQLWNSVSDKVAGGYPYSEGIFEDLNKVIYSGFYWDSRKSAMESVREYIAFEFSAEHVEAISEAIGIMEKNHGLKKLGGKGTNIKFNLPQTDFGAEKAYRLLMKVDNKLSGRIKKSWRWRILLLRAMFDFEIRKTKGLTNEKIEAGLKELTLLYHAENAEPPVRPPLD